MSAGAIQIWCLTSKFLTSGVDKSVVISVDALVLACFLAKHRCCRAEGASCESCVGVFVGILKVW